MAAVQVEFESFVDGLAPVADGHVLEAFLQGESGLGIGSA